VLQETTRIERVYAQRDYLAPAAARRAAGDLGNFASNARDDLALAVSELVANAVRHAPVVNGGQIRLVLESGPQGVRVEVHDPGNGFYPMPDPTQQDGGRGLSIVAAVADRWGIEALDHTVVWCWFAVPGQRNGASRAG
jgi:anti-sigma regulatory factor (Ser/Thr protein kinase)